MTNRRALTSRRSVIIGALSGGGALGAAPAAVSATLIAPETKKAEAVSGGYRETDHIRQAYARMRF